uniref:Sodium-independent sulfate anion transporter n=3 Tax=Lygus hesperus TaxID=30085 RepID=A0A0A9W820_LYGHE
MVLQAAMRRTWSQIHKGFRYLMRPGKKTQPWSVKLKKYLNRRIPITEWMTHYTRDDAVGDLIAGITIALTIIPQSIAYAALAGLDPQYGLNSAFMGSFIYVFFGTIKQVVIVPSSLMALLTLQYTSHLNVDFVILLCFLVGVVELLMGIFNLGFLVSFISAPVVSGFTTATSLIVAISQFKGLFGMNFKSVGMFDTLLKIYDNISTIRTGDTILGVTCFVALLLMRKLKEVQISSDFKGHKVINNIFWFTSTGRNAIAVLITSFIALWYSNNGMKPPFITTKPIESGIPSIMIPPTSTQIGNQTYDLVEMVSELGTGYIIIPIVAILANIAIAKAFVNGTIDATQEMIALSLCNLVGSFFQSIPSCGAFSRSAVINASGVRTPLAGLYSAGLTLLALQFLSPYFYLIPRSTLSAVLISAVIFLVDWEIFEPLWKAGAKLELATVVATGFACLFIGVELGLLFGVIVGLVTLIFKWARPKIDVLRTKTSMGEYIIIRPDLGIFFPSVDYISTYIVKLADEDREEKKPILIDCRDIRDTDYTAAKSFMALTTMFEKRGQKLAFLDVRPQCQKMWKSAGIKNESFWLSENLTENLYGDAGIEDENATRMVEVVSQSGETEVMKNGGETNDHQMK